MNWYYADQGKQIGPLGDAQFEESVRSGKVQPDTLVWREGMPDWVPYREAVAPPIPPAPAPAASSSFPIGQGPEAVCAECGRMFAIQDMIRHGSVYICVNCKPIFMQKLAEGATINTGALNYAGFGTRLAAYMLDAIILVTVNFCIGLVAGLSAAQAAGARPKGAIALQVVLLAINVAIAISYETILIGKYGATLGKMACKIKVVTADGGRVSYLRAIGRYFGKIVSSLTCSIGFIMAAFDGQKRALHDHMCNTRVVLK